MGKAFGFFSVVLSERSEPKDPHLHYPVQFCNPVRGVEGAAPYKAPYGMVWFCVWNSALGF